MNRRGFLSLLSFSALAPRDLAPAPIVDVWAGDFFAVDRPVVVTYSNMLSNPVPLTPATVDRMIASLRYKPMSIGYSHPIPMHPDAVRVLEEYSRG